ncbi:MAG TPA: PxKF domain-containing protein [Gemmatimonadales bacterium]
MRTREWSVCLVLAGLAVACGDQPTAPDREPTPGPGKVALATATSEDGLSIVTDKDDYAPGDTVWFTGAGWAAGDTLDIVLTDDTQDVHEWAVGIAGDGAFRDSTYVVNEGDLNVTFTLTATSRANPARTLTVNFTDGQPQSVALSPTSRSVATSGSASYEVAVTMGGNNNACTVTLEVTTTLPSGVTTAFSGNPIVLPNGSGSTSFSRTLTITTANASPGTYSFTVRATRGSGCQSGGSDPIATGTLVVFGPASKLAFAQQPTDADATSAIAPAVTVQVLDANNNLVLSSSAPVTLSIGTNPGAGTLSGTTVQNAVNGVATFAGLSIDEFGAGYTLLASSGALTGATSSPFTIKVGPASQAAFTAQPSGGTAGTAFTVQPVIAIEDAGGNVKVSGSGSGATVTLSITPGTGASGATLSCNSLALQASAGVASFAGCALSKVGTGYRLRAVASGPVSFQIDSDPFDVGSNNQAPSVDAGGPYSGNEGAGITLSSATASDPDNDALTRAWTYTKVSGHASASCTFDDASAVQPTFTCNDNGTFTVKLTVNDGHSHETSDEAGVTVSNVDPTATFSAESPVDEGSSFTIELKDVNDVSSLDKSIGFTYAFDCGDGNGYDAFGSSSSRSCTTNDDGSRGVKASVKDKDGGVTEYTGSVQVVNVAPAATFNKPTSVNEGSSFTLELANPTDPSSADVSAGLHLTFDCGNGSGYQTSYAGAGTTASITCNTAVDGPATLSVKGRIFDKDGGNTEYTGSVTVNNVAPTITSVSPSPSGQLTLGTNNQVSTTVTVAFTDPAGQADAPFTTAIDCGNGTNAYGAGVCTYTAADVGSMTISATVTDKDGGVSAPKTATVQIIYNWTGFFQPIDNSALNVAKAGSAVPVKFNLGGNQGLAIFVAGSPSSSKVACVSNMDLDTIEETVNAGGSTLTYDAVAQQYVYVWKSDKPWTGTCRRLDVKLIDGTTHSAYFKFK